MSKAKKSKKTPSSHHDVMLLAREREALRRRHRQVVLFNDRELTLINEYCRRNNISAKSSMMRQIIIEKLLTDLGQNPPTLF